MNRRRLLTALVVGGVFLAGALAGVATVVVVDPVREALVGEPPDAPRGRVLIRGGEDRRERGEDRGRGPVYALSRLLHEELDLDEDQERAIEAILQRRRDDARELFRATRQRFREHLDGTVAEVKEVLTSEQADELQRILDELERRRRERGRRR